MVRTTAATETKIAVIIAIIKNKNEKIGIPWPPVAEPEKIFISISAPKRIKRKPTASCRGISKSQSSEKSFFMRRTTFLKKTYFSSDFNIYPFIK